MKEAVRQSRFGLEQASFTEVLQNSLVNRIRLEARL